ncbi:MAG: glycosyltransferase [Bacteroidales bacterium]|nr:glycosyltransferase [Bacteroidales bacterium]
MMKNEPFDISVIIANYNNVGYIGQCIESVLDSDFDRDKMELIIVDDASTDGSVAFIEKMMTDNSMEIKLLHNEVNIGSCRSRNRGIANARGEFVYLLDSDDYLHKRCLQHHFDFLSKNPDFIACYAPVQDFSNDKGEFLKVRSTEPFDYRQLLKGPYISGVALFKTKALIDVGMLNANLPPYGWIDYELWLRLGKMGKKVHSLGGDPLYYYRQHKNTITKGIDYNKMKLLIDFLRSEHLLEFDIEIGKDGKIIYIPFEKKQAQLFLSESEGDSLKIPVNSSQQRFEFTVNSPRKMKQLRFDPINDHAIVKIISTKLLFEGEIIKTPYTLTSNAFETRNDIHFFHTTDPQFTINFNEPVQPDEVVIDVEYLKTGADALIELQDLQNQKSALMEEQITAMKAATEKNDADIKRLIDEKNTNYLHYLETLSELTAIRESRFIRPMLKINNLILSFFRFKLLGKAIEKLQLSLDTLTISRSGFFDVQYYLSNYPDVVGSGMLPEKHFLRFGWKEGRNPSALFDTAFYLATNPDVLATGKNPLIHFIKKGQYENRLVKPDTYQSEKTADFNNNQLSVFKFLKLRQKGKALAPHFAPPKNDFALEIPFVFEDYEDAPPGKIAVFCHIFYTGLVAEIRGYLLNIPFPFDLFITTDVTEKQELIRENFKVWSKGKVAVKVAINRGRDIAPKLIFWKEQYDNFDFCLHIHTKKSPQESVLSNWRQYLYENLLGSEKTVESIFEAFRSDPQLGMIAPQHFTNTRQAVGWGYNFDKAFMLAQKMNIRLKKEGLIDFPSGSMFWVRTAALKPLLDIKLQFDDFPEEIGQTDGTPAHAIERLYFFACEKAGYKWIKISNPKITPYPQRSFEVKKRHELSGIINQLQIKLLNEKGENMMENGLNDKVDLNQRLHFLKVHKASPYCHLEPEIFVRALKLHIAGKASIIDFDETFYQKANPDIDRLVASGIYECGFIHFCLSGQKEKRAWSNRMILSKYNMLPNYPTGMFAPVNIQKKERFENTLLLSTKSPEPFMLILFGHLQKDLFYAGYNAFFKDFMPVFDHFPKIVIAVDNENIEPELATNYCSRIEVMKLRNLSEIEYLPDVILCFSNHQVNKALRICTNPEKIVYYCQEYEAGFFPYGTEYIEAQSAIAKSKNIILSTELLKNFLEQEGLISHSNVFITSPDIEILDVAPEKTKKLFFYFRPEYFHTRNIPEVLWEAVHEFCKRHTGHELFLAGTIDTRFSIDINGNAVYVISKLPKEDYNRLLSSCDVAVAMIYSAHPGVIAFQAAASGIPTVTNIFKNRDAQMLKGISENIIPFDPVRENLCDKVEEALRQVKGNKHFNRNFFSGQPRSFSLSDFILQIAKLE